MVNHGFRGLKLYQPTTISIPTTISCTTCTPPLSGWVFRYCSIRGRRSLPIPVSNTAILFFDDVAVDFPDLKIVMAHGGRGPWYEEAMTMVRLHRNVYIDVTGLPPQKLTEFFPDMRRFADKFVFGTDWPTVDVKKNIEAICSLDLPADAVAKILGQNAWRLLRPN